MAGSKRRERSDNNIVKYRRRRLYLTRESLYAGIDMKSPCSHTVTATITSACRILR